MRLGLLETAYDEFMLRDYKTIFKQEKMKPNAIVITLAMLILIKQCWFGMCSYIRTFGDRRIRSSGFTSKMITHEEG